jgi:aminoglycoside 6-adenylyltransferase
MGSSAVSERPLEADVVDQLVAWATARPEVRALILTSSRARADETADDLSDYDVIVGVSDVDAFLADDAWQLAYGEPAARWGDEAELYGVRTYFRGVVYADGVKIDYTIWPAELLERVAAEERLPDMLDVGYRVLVDKDGATSGWSPPAFRAHIPTPPTESEYRELVEEFWWSATYVAKALRRGELMFAKFALDHDMKLGPLRRFLECRIELDHDWSVRPGPYGRGLERLLPPDLRAELAQTYVGSDIDENWDALFRTTALFRRIAAEVGESLDVAYPQQVDDRVTAHLEALRDSPPVR